MGRRLARARTWGAIVIGSVGLLSLPATGRAETPGTGAPVAGYGTNGVAIHDLHRGADRPLGVKVDGAGRSVVVSYAEVPIPASAPIDESEGIAVAVTRFLPTGARDSSFGTGGVVYLTPPVGPTVYMPIDFAVTADSRIYVLGGASGGTYGPWLTRLEADGDLDPSFGTGGWQLVPGTSPYGAASLILSRPTGGLFLAGIASDPAGPALFVRALKDDGSADPQFGNEGSATIAEPVTLDRVTVAGFALRPDSGVVVASSRLTRPASPPIAIDAVLPNGQTDVAFGAGGRVAPVVPYSVFPDVSLAVHPSGAISIVSDFTLARFLPSGAPDPAFNNGGTVGFGIDTPHQLVADGESLLRRAHPR